jgi:hypothetical protein
LVAHFPTIFTVLHLLLEDLKLNKLHEGSETQRLTRALLKLALTVMDPQKKAAYIEYYARDCP